LKSLSFFTFDYSERFYKVVIARSKAMHCMVQRAKRRACALKRSRLREARFGGRRKVGAQAGQSHEIAPETSSGLQ